MKVNEMLPGKYLRADDLDGPVATTIMEVRVEEFGEQKKPVVVFDDEERVLVLNRTNADTIRKIADSDDSTDWTGVVISVVPAMTDFKGKRVSCIRIQPTA